jgi:hypothetical protein
MSIGHRAVPAHTDGPLEEVLEAERVGAVAIAEARAQADAWLAVEKDTIQRAAGQELAALETSHAADLDAARRHAAAQAAAVVAAAEAFSQQLQALADEDLRPIVAHHAAAILPGGAP